MHAIGPILARLRIGRFRDWYRFTWARLLSPGVIEAESLPFIDPPFRLKMAPGSKLVLGRDVRFNAGFTAYLERGVTITIGDRTLFNVNCWLSAIEGLTIGADCLFAPMVAVTDANHRYGDPDVPISQQGFDVREVHIGDGAWLGAKASVINSVGAGAVVGANAVVTHPVPAGVVAVGIPARVVRPVRSDE